MLETGADSKLSWTVESHSRVPEMPNPLREKAKTAHGEDCDLAVLMVEVWQDDASGNVSKQYDPHLITCVRNTALPGRLLQQDFHIHHVSSSQHASAGEQFAAVRDIIRSTEQDPIQCFDSHCNKNIAIIVRAPGLPADNPQQSIEASHIGCNANFPCRKCAWGATTIDKTSPEIYHACHLSTGVKRTASQIRDRLQTQLDLATRGDAKSIKELQMATGTKDKVTQYWIDKSLARFSQIQDQQPDITTAEISTQVSEWLQHQPGDKMNPLLDITGLDPAQDTPVELLHTVLLGVMKYIWHFLNTAQWSDSHRQLLAIRLQSTDISGLSIPPIRAAFMIQYRNNLIGKHFKTLMQILALHTHDICTPEQFSLILAAADLGARLWIPEIDDMESYLADLNIGIANLLDAFDVVDPLRILVKIKLHLLAHLPDDIRRFGPAIRFSTEAFEAYNAIFRACSVRSNRQAPSRDIARKLASIERVKHIFAGGYWYNQQCGKWVCAAESVQELLVTIPVFQRHLGWVSPKLVECGTVQLISEKRQPTVDWAGSGYSPYWRDQLGPLPTPNSRWRSALTVAAKNGDLVRPLCWVFALASPGEYILGRVTKILVAEQVLIVLERFVCTEIVHPDFKWPVIRRPNGPEIINGMTSYVLLNPPAIQFVCSVAHDCRRGACQPVAGGKERQEREDTIRDTSLLKHTDDDRFVLNLAAFHNFAEIRRILPREYTCLKLLHDDRESFHRVTALKAQDLRKTRQQKTAAKRKAKTAEKKRIAAEAATEAAETEAQQGTEADTAAQNQKRRAKVAEKKRLAAVAAAEAAAAEMEEEDSDPGSNSESEDDSDNDVDYVPQGRMIPGGDSERTTRAQARAHAV
ncbi:FAD-binding-3 domain-containing protein [Mycena indigotica]|uniref:FAD-binding-3 domain-containing protein n=1 Tax=Mycena indigotica TaxID=2126181 RepID=A0A8H6T4N6_9AGAR|nr:FAD-binding-3 domain-containing protein [Mycena indigotica]KAF7310181.1 FAD-binding-3 domain-containing protein [Mycena indigotica]